MPHWALAQEAARTSRKKSIGPGKRHGRLVTTPNAPALRARPLPKDRQTRAYRVGRAPALRARPVSRGRDRQAAAHRAQARARAVLPVPARKPRLARALAWVWAA